LPEQVNNNPAEAQFLLATDAAGVWTTQGRKALNTVAVQGA
jgi:hypothetical protein